MPANGFVFLVHGLNNRPDVLDPFGDELSRAGFAVERIALRGHGSGESLWQSSARAWLDETEAKIRQRSREALPVCVLAYSLGAAVISALLNRASDLNIASNFFLAPAVRFTTWASPRRLLAPLHSLPLALPSLAPGEVRLSSWTPLRAYRALFEIADSLRTIPPESALRKTRTKLLILKGDELVSSGGLQSWIAANGLASWQMVEPPPGFFREVRSKHSINIRSRYTAEEWRWLNGEIRNLFETECNKNCVSVDSLEHAGGTPRIG